MFIRKISTLLVCGTVLASIGNVMAAVPTGAHFYVGAQGAHHKFLNKNISGWNGGAEVSAAYHFSNHFYLDSNLRFSLGALHLKNSKSAGGKKMKLDSSRLDARAVGGYHFDTGNNLYLSPYFGIGFDRYEMKHKFVKFDIGVLYLPMGLKATFNLIPKCFDLTISAEYDYYLNGKYHAKRYKPSAGKLVADPNTNVKAGKLHGFRVDMMFANKFANGTAISYGPYFNHTQGIKKEDRDLKFTEVGAKLKFHF